MPIFEKAVKAVNRLKSDNVTELKGFIKVASGVMMVAKVLCLMFNKLPRIRKGTSDEDALELYWQHCKKELLNARLLNELKSYPKEDQN